MSGGWLSGTVYPTLIALTLLYGLRQAFVPTPWRATYLAYYAAFAGLALESFVIDSDHWRHYFLCIGVLWGLYWFLVLSKRERTDDAYVNGNKVVISAQVSGTVIAVLTDDTQLVKAGQVLARIDGRDYEVALDQAKANVAAMRAAIVSKEAAIDAQQSAVESANALARGSCSCTL